MTIQALHFNNKINSIHSRHLKRIDDITFKAEELEKRIEACKNRILK